MKRGKIWIGTALGAVAGGIAGLLLAPKSGKQLRKMIAGETKRRSRKIKAKGLKLVNQEIKKLTKKKR